MDPFLEKVASVVGRGLWHTTHVEADQDGPAFTYTTGLWRNFQAPEIVVVGPDAEHAYALVDEIAAAMKAGFRPEFRRRYDEFIEGAPVEFVRVDERHYETMFEHAVWFYTHSMAPPVRFPVVQCVLPNIATGAFPWEAGYPDHFHDIQPLLGFRA
jgi:hypothetical protein